MGYIAIIHKDPGSDFGVSFPDFPGCITAGRTKFRRRWFRFAEFVLIFAHHAAAEPEI